MTTEQMNDSLDTLIPHILGRTENIYALLSGVDNTERHFKERQGTAQELLDELEETMDMMEIAKNILTDFIREKY